MRSTTRLLSACGLAASITALAHAGGTPENALLIIDPLSPDSLHVGNYYWHARTLLPNAVLYLDPDATNYPAWVSTVQPGFLGELTQRTSRSHIDYAIITPGNSFYVSAPSLLSDGCWPVNRFSISAAFTISQISSIVLAGTLPSTSQNRYAGISAAPRWFDSETSYSSGEPSTASNARAYFIGCMLGYSGTRGNTIPEILSMIDRSVAADGTRPTGTFAFMNNTADSARNVRATSYGPVITAMPGFGYPAVQINGTLPTGGEHCLGLMTGFSNADIAGGAFTLLPGAFADHLTSFAATYDEGGQTKVSEWIRKGASGTSGAIEEPCNYLAKFPHPRLHAYYAQGMSLGESFLRSHAGTPFQTLFVGDPLTRTFTHIPSVSVPDAPTDPVSGLVTLTPLASTTAPAASIASLDLLIDGVVRQTASPGMPFTIDTKMLNDGWHDIRVLAYDSTTTRSVGRWIGDLDVSNSGRAATAIASPASGDLTTAFSIDVSVTGPEPDHISIIHQGRVVASRSGSGPVQVHGRILGAGPVTLWAHTTFPDGTEVRSRPISLTISTNAPAVSTPAPVAFSYTRLVNPAAPFVLELPSTFADALSAATYQILIPPGGSSITGGSGAARVLTPSPSSCGIDEVTFNVTTPGGTSNTATITLIYADPTPCPADLNHDCVADIVDFLDFLDAFGTCQGQSGPCGTNGINADYNRDATVDVLDLLDFFDAFGSGCA